MGPPGEGPMSGANLEPFIDNVCITGHCLLHGRGRVDPKEPLLPPLPKAMEGHEPRDLGGGPKVPTGGMPLPAHPHQLLMSCVREPRSVDDEANELQQLSKGEGGQFFSWKSAAARFMAARHDSR